MELRLIGEMGINDTLLALEPSRKCIASCSWCYYELNGRAARAAGKSRPDHGPDTFARTVNRAFGPEYDPTDFLQFALKEKLPITWASGVEPWQDLPQALATFDVIDRLDLPVFVQTRGTRWRDVWPQVKARGNQVALYVSMPSDDPAYVKRYEPGTPKVDERIALLEAAADADIPTMLAVAPYHPDWCDDLPGLVRRAIDDWGVRAIFLDPLHVNATQAKVATDPTLVPLAASAYEWGERMVNQLTEARAECVARDVTWHCQAWKAAIHRVESYKPVRWHRYDRSTRFGYQDETIFDLIHPLIEDDDAKPVLLTWPDALAAMEADGAIDQRFKWSSLGQNIRQCTQLPVSWRDRLKQGGTVGDYLRALWNNPTSERHQTPSGFVWGHPFVRLAVKPDGTPWMSESGDVVAMFDPNYEPKKFARTIEDPSIYDIATFQAESQLQAEE